MPQAARWTARVVAVVLALLALSPSAQAVPMVQLATSLSIQAKANGRVVDVNGRLVDVRDRAIKGAVLNVKLDAIDVQTATTNAAGDWSASVALPDSLPAGSHEIIVTYAGADGYKPTANSVAVNIDAPTTSAAPSAEPPGLKPTTLTATVPAGAHLWGSLVNVTGNLTGPNGAQISGAPISVTGPSGIRSDCLTDDGGAYACEIAVPDVQGSVNVQATFESLQGFDGSTATATLQVKAPPTPTATAEEPVESEEPTPSASVSAPASSAAPSASVSAPPSAVATAPLTQSNYTPLLIALVVAFIVLGLGVLALFLMRSSRKEPVEQFIDPDEERSLSLLTGDEPLITDDEPLVSEEPVAAPAGRYAAVSTGGHRFGMPARSAKSNAPRRALD